MKPVSGAELLRRMARAARVDAFYGAPLAALGVVPVPSELAGVFAVAHQQVHGRRAAAHLGDGVFRLPAFVEGPSRIVELSTARDLADAMSTLTAPGEVELRLPFDLHQPVAVTMPTPSPSAHTWAESLDADVDALQTAASAVMLAGPRVVRDAAVPGLHDLAVGAGLGVLNTWGAKGIFHWQSRHHLATVGLQADDFVLGGLRNVDLIVATGLDSAESPDHRWQLAPSIVVSPEGLAPLAERCAPRPGPPEMPPLRAQLAAVTQRGWAVERGPLPPSRVTMHYAEGVVAGSCIAADAGTAGYWVARTLGTTKLGSVIVPSTSLPGFAAACVAVSLLRHPARPALAVTDGQEEGEVTVAVVDAAKTLGLDVPVEAWDPEGERLDAEAHRARLYQLLNGERPSATGTVTLATDPRQLDEMLDVAGPIVAWT